MKIDIKGRLIVLALGISLAAAVAGSTYSAPQRQYKDNDSISMSGCLRAHHHGDRYILYSSDKQYILSSRGVSLNDGVGHKVTVTGKLSRTPSVDGNIPGKIDVYEINEVKGKCG